jgi:hypothetical protein
MSKQCEDWTINEYIQHAKGFCYDLEVKRKKESGEETLVYFNWCFFFLNFVNLKF